MWSRPGSRRRILGAVAMSIVLTAPAARSDTTPATCGEPAIRVADEAALLDRLGGLRAEVKTRPESEDLRAALAEISVRVAAQIDWVDRCGPVSERTRWIGIFRERLADTLWRLGKLAESGRSDAGVALGVLHEIGIVVPRDRNAACDHYLRAARAGAELAKIRAARCVATAPVGQAAEVTMVPTESVPAGPDRFSAVLGRLAEAIESAEARGREEVAASLAQIIEEHLAGDLAWVSRSSAEASPRDASALALLYRRGILVERDPARACELYRAGARFRHAASLYRAGLCAAEEDREQSLGLISAAAGLGHAGARELLARDCIERGDRECAEAMSCGAAAAGRSSAHSLLGWLHSGGSGWEPDPKKALFHFVLAARGGDAAAQNNLGEIYETGRHVAPDARKARIWYARAAGAGLPAAQVNLARLYIDGRGGAKDLEAARRWLRRANDAGEPQAARILDWLEAREDVTR